MQTYDLALKDYEKVIELNPKNPDVYKKRGVVFILTGKYETALENFTQAIRLGANAATLQTHINLCQKKIAAKDTK